MGSVSNFYQPMWTAEPVFFLSNLRGRELEWARCYETTFSDKLTRNIDVLKRKSTIHSVPCERCPFQNSSSPVWTNGTEQIFVLFQIRPIPCERSLSFIAKICTQLLVKWK